MRIKVTIGCSVCSFKRKNTIELPFDCDSIICPKCCVENSLSIIAVHDEPSVFRSPEIRNRLQSMKKIHAG